MKLVNQLIERSNVFGYGEIQEYAYGSATHADERLLRRSRTSASSAS